MKLSARMRMKAKGIYLSVGEPLAATVNGYAKEVESLESQLSKSKSQYNELVGFVLLLQLDSVSDDYALEMLLERHNKERQ